jgi:hypothetical protein
MWPNEKSRRDRSGRRWNFHYQYFGKNLGQRLFFWDDDLTEHGVLIFPKSATRSYVKIEDLIDKLVSDASLRGQHQRELRFPLNRYYSDYGAFPEEKSA